MIEQKYILVLGKQVIVTNGDKWVTFEPFVQGATL